METKFEGQDWVNNGRAFVEKIWYTIPRVSNTQLDLLRTVDYIERQVISIQEIIFGFYIKYLMIS